MRKLTVKNFSVIKDAKLEFGKITVLIGPQASGKSLLCRLAFFFSQYLPEFANNVASRRPPLIDISRAIQQRFADWFPTTTWSGDKSEIVYTSGQDSVSVSIEALGKQPQLRFCPEFVNDYESWKTSDQNLNEARRTIDMLAGPFRPSGSIYIPSGRAFFSTPNRSMVAVSQKNLDWITQRFSTELDFDYRAMIASSSERVEMLHDFGEQTEKILHGRVVFWDGSPRFQFTADSRILPFDLLSSGTLELLPLLNPLGKLISSTKFSKYFDEPDPTRGPIFIEEPESGVFPETQYELVRLFASLSNESTLNQSFAITTHSPYILSAFGNLLKAGKVGVQSAEHHAAVEKTVPERYWIKNSDFAAYKIENGVLKSIYDEDTGQIDGDYLDDVSSDIAEEFGQLLEIQYGG
jgi:hypothetical protein